MSCSLSEVKILFYTAPLVIEKVHLDDLDEFDTYKVLRSSAVKLYMYKVLWSSVAKLSQKYVILPILHWNLASISCRVYGVFCQFRNLRDLLITYTISTVFL